MNDVIALLAEANPVQVEGLGGLGLPDLTHRPRPGRRAAAVVVLAAAFAAAVVGVVLSGDTSSRRTGSGNTGPTEGLTTPQGPTGPMGPAGPTIANPVFEGMKVTLPAAAAAIGIPLVLPDTPLVGLTDVGPVWANSGTNFGIAAVTYPAQGLFVSYYR